MMPSDDDFKHKAVCKVCGKNLWIPNMDIWAYKFSSTKTANKVNYFCSWSCMRYFEKKHPRLLPKHDWTGAYKT